MVEIAVELGVGYLSIVPSMGDFKRKLDAAVGRITTSVTVIPDTARATAAFRNLKVPTLEATVNPRVEGFTARLRGLIGNQSSVGQSMGDTAGNSLHEALTSAARRTAATIATIFAGQKLFDVGKQAFAEAANFQTAETAFAGLLGSSEAATAKLDELFQFAAVTPFEFPQLTDASRKLLAFGVSADQIVPTMQTLGDAAAALGASGTDINLVVRALGQALGKGRIQMEEINQIAENFPGSNPIPALAKAVNASVPDFVAAMALPGGALKAFGLDGKRAVEIILESFKDIPGAMGAMERQSKTLNGVLSTLKDTLRITAIQSLRPFLPGIADFVRLKIVPALEKLGVALPAAIQRMAARVGPVLKSLGGKLRDFRDAVGVGFSGDIAGSVSKGWTGVLEVAGSDLRRFVDYVKKNFPPAMQAFKDGFSGKGINPDGFLGIVFDIGQATAKLVKILSEDVPKAILDFRAGIEAGVRGIEQTGFSSTIGDVGVKLGGLIKVAKDNPDVFEAVAVGIASMAASMLLLKQAQTGVSVLSGLVGLIPALTNPVTAAAVAIGVLAAGAVLAYQKLPLFRDAVDAVAKVFKEEGFGAAVEEAGAQIGRLWDVVRPKLQQFLSQAKSWFKTHVADLLNFQVGTAGAAPGLPAGAEPIEPPTPTFDSFSKGVAAALTEKVLPAVGNWFTNDFLPFVSRKLSETLDFVGDWIVANEPAIVNALIGITRAFNKWVDTSLVPAIEQSGPKLVGAFVVAQAGFLGALLQAALDAIGRITVAALVSLNGFISDQLDEIGRMTVGALDAVGRFTVDSLATIGQFSVAAGAEVAVGLGTIGAAILGALDGVGRFTVEALAAIGRFAVEATAEIAGALGGLLLTLLTLPEQFFDAADGIWDGMWDGIYTAFKSALNLVIRAWNGLEFKLPSFGGLSLFGQTIFPSFEGPTLSTPDIPELAGGGVFNQEFAGMLRLAETPAARPEIVTPQRLMAETFRAELAAFNGGRGGVTIEHMDIREQQSAARVVDEINTRLGWMLTTRAER